MRNRRLVLAAGAAGVAGLLLALPASAWAGTTHTGASGAAFELDITGAHQSVVHQAHDRCAWTVTASVVTVNLTNSPLTVVANPAGVDYPYVTWNDSPGSASGQDTAVTVVDNGGLGVGTILAAGGTQTWAPYKVTFSIPCTATNGDLAVGITTNTGGSNSGDAPFLVNGAALPLAAEGALGLAAAVGLGFAGLTVRHRWQRRHAPFAAGGPPTGGQA